MLTVLNVLALVVGATAIFSGDGVAQSVTAKQVKQPFSITISVETTTVKAGSGLTIMVHMTNTSDHDINASSVYIDGVAGIDGSYDEEVRDSKGRLAKSEKSVAQNADPTAPLSLSVRLHTLKPGESTGSVTGVSPEYDISKPGEYLIQLSGAFSDNPKDGVVKSNVLKITVAP